MPQQGHARGHRTTRGIFVGVSRSSLAAWFGAGDPKRYPHMIEIRQSNQNDLFCAAGVNNHKGTRSFKQVKDQVKEPLPFG